MPQIDCICGIFALHGIILHQGHGFVKGFSAIFLEKGKKRRNTKKLPKKRACLLCILLFMKPLPRRAESRFAKPRQTFRKESFKDRQGRRKDLIWFVWSCYLCELIRGLQNLESFQKDLIGMQEFVVCVRWFKVCRPSNLPWKVLIVAVRSCGCGVLIRGLQNLESLCKGIRVVTFCVVQKVTKKHTGRSPATHDSNRRSIRDFSWNNRHSSGNRFCEKLQFSGYRRQWFESVRRSGFTA